MQTMGISPEFGNPQVVHQWLVGWTLLFASSFQGVIELGCNTTLGQ